MVSALVGHLIEFFGRCDDVVFEFAHRLHAQSGTFREGFACLVEDVLGRAGKGLSLAVEEGAEDVERGLFGEGVEECGVIARHHVEVAASGLDEGEEARAVHTFAGFEHGAEMVLVEDDEVQRLQAAAPTAIVEVEVAHTGLAAVAHDVFTRKFMGKFPQVLYQRIGIHRNTIIHDSDNK